VLLRQLSLIYNWKHLISNDEMATFCCFSKVLEEHLEAIDYLIPKNTKRKTFTGVLIFLNFGLGVLP